MAIELPLNSRYRSAEVIMHNGIEMLGRFPDPSWMDSEPVRTIIVNAGQQGRLDRIANDELGSSDFWWVLMYYNGKTDMNWPRTGDEVNIPKKNLVLGT